MSAVNASPAADPPRPLVSARGISKQFAGVEVLSDVDLDLAPGEIHALLGENGAGAGFEEGCKQVGCEFTQAAPR
jgi:ABC-type phosphonate transport system ATPase subunit